MIIEKIGNYSAQRDIRFSANNDVFKSFRSTTKPDTFVSKATNIQSQSNMSKWVYGAIAGALLLGGIFLHRRIKNNGKSQEIISPLIQELKNKYNEIIAKYPSDKDYYTKLAKGLGLPQGEEYKLSSIVGEEQLKDLLTKFSPKDFAMGKEFEGVKNRTFRVNLHNHTMASDGKLSIEEFLEHSRKWADEVFSKIGNDGKPAYTIAITDHDTMEGAKKALEIISKSPEKFKNLRVVLGSEISVSHINPNDIKTPFDFEFIGYSLNPYNEKLSTLLKNVVNNRVNFAKSMLEEINAKCPKLNLSWEEAKTFHPNIQRGTSNGAAWLIEEYAKFKMSMQYLLNFMKEAYPYADINFNISNLIEKYSKDYYYRMDTGKYGINRGDVFKYFRDRLTIEMYPINFHERNLSIIDLNNIKTIREKYTSNPQLLKEKGIVLTPDNIFKATKEGGNEGFFGFAHPGFFNLSGKNWGQTITDYCKQNPGNNEGLHFIWRLIKSVKDSGGKLFNAMEKNYQSYGSSDIKGWSDKIFDIAKKGNIDLLKAGGLDCHKTIFTKHEVLSDDLIKTLNIENIVR